MMRYHTEHAPRHTKSVAHTGNKMRNIKNQLLGWVLIACLVCTTVALPTQRTDAFVPVAPLVAPAIGSAVTTYSPVVVGFFTAYAAYTAGTIKDKITQEACRKNFGQNICQNVNPVSAVSAITVAAMVISDTCKGMDVVTCGKKLWEKLSKFIQEMLNKSKVTNGKFTIDRLKKCFNNLSCTQKDWAIVFQPSEATNPPKTPITPKSQQGSGGSTTTSTKPQMTPSQKKPTPTKKSGQYPGIHSALGQHLFMIMKKRKEDLAKQAKRSDLLPGQVKQIEEELKIIDKSKSTLLAMQRDMEKQDKIGPTFSQSDNNRIQAAIDVEKGVLYTLAQKTDMILGTWKRLGAAGDLVKNPVNPVQGKKSATQETSASTKQTNGFSGGLKFPNRNLSNKLLDDAYPDTGMGRSGGLDDLSDSVTPQLGDPSTRVETGKCWGPKLDNNAIVMHLLQSKDTMGKKYKITNLELFETAYGLMLRGVLDRKTVFILPCVPIAGYNTFFVGTMAELQALLNRAQAQGKLRYDVRGEPADVVEKVTKPL